jgi:hypothetical protein
MFGYIPCVAKAPCRKNERQDQLSSVSSILRWAARFLYQLNARSLSVRCRRSRIFVRDQTKLSDRLAPDHIQVCNTLKVTGGIRVAHPPGFGGVYGCDAEKSGRIIYRGTASGCVADIRSAHAGHAVDSLGNVLGQAFLIVDRLSRFRHVALHRTDTREYLVSIHTVNTATRTAPWRPERAHE